MKLRKLPFRQTFCSSNPMSAVTFFLLFKYLQIDLFQIFYISIFFTKTGHGTLIYDLEGQDVHCGGSGCGCSAVVLAGMLLNGMAGGRWKRILFCGTGALLSPTSSFQGESIPGICHAVLIENKV